ncbi:hypothetical protein M3P36_04070 [Altererythrobacter sp. KTW20L]|uniref:hypothetical protein n=1 Tax=Altererythrobacter sp. KTW20L TaxID=2942210 RepID=UPI0020C0C920|nr:hypothetical protein [Altererythrobacter sp. KTW20L]MCL6250226.1 hypothetical protein [Altererythrobacter sp. KTW20L]
MTAADPIRWSAFASRPAAVLAVWALWCVVALAAGAAQGFAIDGPDNWMRLFEVRDLLAGQSWFDVAQYRIDPPHGASMHWSRLVDLPLVVLVLLLGETAAMALVPLLWLLPALFALRAIMLRLGSGPLALALALIAMPMFPLLPDSFLPMRIDHHAPQAVLGLCVAALLLQPARSWAALAGVLAAAWLVISLEGLPMVAGMAGVLGLAWWLDGDRRLGVFLATLAVAAPLLSLATRPASAFALPYCDILLPGHMLAFAAAAGVALLLPVLPWKDRRAGRLVGLALIPLASLPLALAALGPCLTSPFGEMDPLVRRFWYENITEGLPVWSQQPAVIAMLAWSLGLVVAGWWQMKRDGVGSAARARDGLALVALLACLFSFMLMRAGVLAQMLAIPFAAVLLATWLPRARAIPSALPRIGATLACFALATPMVASGAAKLVETRVLPGAATAVRVDRDRALDEECDFSRLAALPPGHMLVPMDAGPEILGHSGHTILAASYHRNQPRMRDVIVAFSGPVAGAHEVVRRNGADYVVACTAKADFAFYRSVAPGNFADALDAGQEPDWLEPVTGFEEGPLKVYRVR